MTRGVAAILALVLAVLMASTVAEAGTSSYVYDERGRLTSYTPPVPQEHPAVTYTYNNLNEKTSVTSGSYGVQYEYFANGWLKAIKSGAQTIASFAYDAVGNRTQVDYGNGTYVTYDYGNDARYLISSVSHFRQGNQTPLLTISYPTRDNVGNPTSMQDQTGQWTYSYDANNRLASAVPPNPVPEQPAGGSYGYDWVGNRRNSPASPNPMTYNAADQLTSYPGMHSYTYNTDGSLKEVRSAQGVLTTSHTYTPDGLLESTTSNGKTITHSWDADRNRLKLDVDGDEYDFVYDITAGTPSVIEEMSPTGTVRYFREPNGALIARVKDGDWRYYHFDALGSTKLLTDGSGSVTDKLAYDSYGSVISHDRYEGSVEQPYQYVGRYGYYTHYQEPELRLVQTGMRFYDTETGTFTQRDPADNTGNTYSYAGSRPTVAVDPLGLAYIIYHGNTLCLYHGDGTVWLCCKAESGGAKGAQPISPGVYRLDPCDIRFCNLQCLKWEIFEHSSWGDWRVHLQPVNVFCPDQPHTECFIHGGCMGNGTLGCIRVDNDCLQTLMNLLKSSVKTPIRVTVPCGEPVW